MSLHQLYQLPQQIHHLEAQPNMKTITKSRLIQVINETIQECLEEQEFNSILNEVSPPGEESKIHSIKKSLRKSHPKWSEDKVIGVAIATAWKQHPKTKE